MEKNEKKNIKHKKSDEMDILPINQSEKIPIFNRQSELN